MNKKLFILTAVIAFMTINTGMNAMADETKTPDINNEYAIHKPMAHHYMGEVPKGAKHFGPGPQVDKDHPMKFNTPKHFDKAEMQAKKAEFEKRLNLTEEQKLQIEKNRKKDHEKVKPIFEEIAKKKAEIKSIKEDASLSQQQKDKKIEKLKKDIKSQKEKAKKYQQENMKNFESVLTKEQKAEFTKIREEQKAEMLKRRLQFRQNHPQKGQVLLPKEPKPVVKTKDVQIRPEVLAK